MAASGEIATAGMPTSAQIGQLTRMVVGYRVSQAIGVFARLGLPDLLKDGPRGIDELADVTQAHSTSLFRLLRFLAGVEIVEETAPRRFALTSLGTGLRSDVPRSVGPMALNLLSPHLWASWGDLIHSVRTGETAFAHVHGVEIFDFLAQNSDAATLFDRYMTSNTEDSGTAIVEAYDFSEIERLADVGGGQGRMIATILKAHPSMRGILFDRPNVTASAASFLESAGVADRCEIVGGDFFASIPAGADAYILRQILHDWGDADALRILKNCRMAMKPTSRVLVIERAIAPDYPHAMPVLQVDMTMLVNTGGVQRTDDEHRTLFADAGFDLTRIVPLNDIAQYAVYEGMPV
ncbi:MAG: methyltransferase [Chloroflexi bacterium]|nr:methyltransferase [Chloroflexota bacterium]